MAFTPDPNLFVNSVGGGYALGQLFSQPFRDRRRQGELARLAEMARAEDFAGLGSGLVGMGEVGAGINALQVPFERDQLRLQREFQNQQFMDNRDFRNRQFDWERGQDELRNALAAAAEARANAALNTQRPPEGFQVNPDGTMGPVPGGPADPAYAQRLAEAKGAGKPEKYTNLPVNVQNQIAEADQVVMGSRSVVATMADALRLNDLALSGPMSGERGAITGFFGSESGQATTELNNLVTGSALESLKFIFGSMPTEGERKILLDIQGSSDQPPAVRERIFTRAIAAALAREEYNRRRAKALRDGTYYDVGFDPQPVAFDAFMPQAENLVKEIKASRKTNNTKQQDRVPPGASPRARVTIDGYTIEQVD